MKYRDYQVLQTSGSHATRYARIREARERDQAAKIAELLLAGCRYLNDNLNYLVSPQGDVFSLHDRRVIQLRPGTKPGGYRFVGIRCAEGLRYRMVHRLIAVTFIPNPDNLPEVNHKDGIKNNNSVINLEWCTSGQNHSHAVAIGLIKTGIAHHHSKLTAEEVRAIREASGAYRSIGARYGVCAQTVCNVKNRVRYEDVP